MVMSLMRLLDKIPVLTLVVLMLAVLLVSHEVKSAHLNTNGGYDIVVGVQDGTPPQDPAYFYSHLQQSMQNLSEEMWRTTNRQFFISSVRLVVPKDWNSGDPDVDPENIISFHSSDIRVSSHIPRPKAINPNLCGRPGEAIELPDDFFDGSEPYGSRWKVLLQKWASYRWGVWEEHGYPGSDEFPYYHKEPGSETEWEFGACTDTPLVGSFVYIGPENDKDDAPQCQKDTFYSPGPNCRFALSENADDNSAVSSLMNFHWLDTIADFCNETTHQIHLRNKQNLFCGHTSASDVIVNSLDYRKVNQEELVDLPPALGLEVVKSHYRPLLYILMDNGNTTASEYIIDALKANLEKLVTPGILAPDTIASLNIYPGTDSGDGAPISSKLVSWSRIWEAVNEFLSEIREYDPSSTEFRDFSRALLEANDEIQHKNSFHGGVVLIIKTGATEHEFDHLLREHDVITRLQDANINVFAIEISDSTREAYVNLGKVAASTNGRHLKITETMSEAGIEEGMGAVFQHIKAALEGSQVVANTRNHIIFKAMVRPEQEIELPILPSGLSTLKLHLTIATEIQKETVVVSNGPVTPILFSYENDWNEAVDVSAASILTSTMGNPVQREPWKLKYSCTAEVESDCEGLLVLYGEFKSEQPENAIQIEVQTSAIDNEVDFGQPFGTSPPFAVYARVLNAYSVPLRNLQVTATVAHIATGDELIITLRDNGLGSPDLYKNDGTYSGYVFPTIDGEYEISVSVVSELGPDNDGQWDNTALDDSIEFPLPEYQVIFGCANGNPDDKCDGVSSPLQISRSYTSGQRILVKNVGDFTHVLAPAPILDLSFWAGNDFNIILKWTSPFIIGNDAARADSYEIRYADTPEAILNDFESAPEVSNTLTPAAPGEVETFMFNARDDGIGTGSAKYYAIRAVHRGASDIKAESSNIVGILPTESEFATTTTEVVTEDPISTTMNPVEGNTRGYDIVIAIDDRTNVPEDTAEFLQDFWDTIQAFSSVMFKATHHHFYIRSAELVVPASWNATNVFSADSYATAHIRVSPSVNIPRTDNPNPCGESGSYIELPFSFFSAGSSQYGSPDKALLHLWARYRWGVWEEHGYPGSTRFPYFYKRAENEWQPVGCSDEQLRGEYLNLEGESGTCDNDGEYSPGPECRFYPFANNTATSSLMYFSSLESVVNFCTPETHNKEAPNKQNLFCQHKSTWEVIESSRDFNTGEQLLDTLPPLNTKITTKTTRPLFYVLLDRGRSMIPESTFTTVKDLLSSLFDSSIPNGVVSAIGSYPDPNFAETPDAVSIVSELKPWTHTVVADEDFKSIIRNHTLDGPSFRDFGLALYDTVNAIKAKKHAPGAIIVVLKVGAGGNFGNMNYEEEIIAAAIEAKIKVFVVEMRNTVTRPNVHLVNLVNTLGGRHVTIGMESEVLLIEYIILPSIYNQFRDPVSVNNRVIYKGMVSQDDELKIHLYPADLISAQVSFTTDFGLRTISITYGPNEQDITPSVEKEWGELTDGDARYVYNTTIVFSGEVRACAPICVAQDSITDEFTLQFTCPPNVPPETLCSGFLIIYGLVKSNQADPYNIQVSASSRHFNSEDNAESKSVSGPFNIFAKVERNGRPIKNLASVKATIYNVQGAKSWTTDLEDNGFGSPDIYRNDGVYSSTFIPNADGIYRVFVVVEHNSTDEIGELHREHTAVVASYANTNARLLPIDQLNPGCSIGQCNAIEPVETFIRVQDLQYSIVADGFTEWETKFVPARISNLRVWAVDDFSVNLYWTSPVVHCATSNNVDEELRVDEYKIYVADNIDTLLGEFSGPIFTAGSPNAPGEEEFWHDRFVGFSATYFIGVRGRYKGIEGAMSNIVKIITQEKETITTTPLPTTTTEEPTEPEISTETTTLSTTTRRTTTTTTTRPPVTTDEPITTPDSDEDNKSWIQKPEGYLTLVGFGVGVIIIATLTAAYMFFRDRCFGNAKDIQKQKLVNYPQRGHNRV